MPVVPASFSGYTHPTSGTKLIERAMRLLGALASGESAAPEELRDGLEALNQMLDAWNTEGLMLYAVTESEFNLVSGTQEYTVGPGGDFDMVRPSALREGEIWLRNDGQDLPLSVYDSQRWSAILQKDTASTLPSAVYYETGFPLGTLWFWPKPDSSYTAVLWNPTLLQQISEAGASLVLPPGYAEAIAYGLAIRLAPEYGKAASGEVVAIANTTKANVKRANSAPALCAVDDALLNNQRRFNINTGQ